MGCLAGKPNELKASKPRNPHRGFGKKRTSCLRGSLLVFFDADLRRQPARVCSPRGHLHVEIQQGLIQHLGFGTRHHPCADGISNLWVLLQTLATDGLSSRQAFDALRRRGRKIYPQPPRAKETCQGDNAKADQQVFEEGLKCKRVTVSLRD